MNVPDIEKLYKGIQICLDMNSHISESSACMERLPKTTKEGFDLSYEMAVAALKMRDVELLDRVYALSANLIPDEKVLDSVVFYNLKKLQKRFEKRLLGLLKAHPSFLLKYKMVQLTDQKRAQTDEIVRQQIQDRINLIYGQIILPHQIGFQTRVK